MRPDLVLASAVSILSSLPAHAHDFKIGDSAECSGNAGTVVRIEPRAGWDEPFFVVSVPSGATTYEFRCVPSQLRHIAGPQGAAAAAAASGTSDTFAAPAGGAISCTPDAKLEGQWGISWYEVTVLAAEDANGKCLVRFDGYGSEWDMPISTTQLRPRGSGPVTRPDNPVAAAPPAGATAATADATAPDGTYACHKISPGGQLISIGTLVISGGQGEVAGMPDDWTVSFIAPRGRNDRGELVVAVDYRSASGFNDRLDCIVQ